MAILLETLNKVAIVPALVLLVVLGRHVYHARRSSRWPHPTVGFMMATMVLIFFLSLRYSATVLWYVVDQQLFPVQTLFLIAIIGMISGLLLMIHAISNAFVSIGAVTWTLLLAFVLLVR